MVSNYAVVSYTPTLGVLMNARQALVVPTHKNSKVVLAAVSRPFTTKWASLPSVHKEVECVRNAIPSVNSIFYLGDVEAQRLVSHAPTAKAILEHLPSASVLHLACHGHQNAFRPLQSGFVVQDTMLTVGDLMSLNLKNAFFAFLSACETAKGDKAQPDQVIHLAAAMLIAGFKSVVGTMW